MGNFVSFPRSRQTPPPPFPRRRIENDAQTPEPPSPSSSPPCTGRCSLASSLVMRAGQLVKVFRCRTRLADVEEGMLPTGDRTKDGTGTVTAQGIPRPGSSSRRRALLVGISYNGELLNAHKDVDRYCNVLLGMLHIVLPNVGLYIVSFVPKARMDTGRRTSQYSRTIGLSRTTSSRRAITLFSPILCSPLALMAHLRR
jgi:hypothetical protein